MSLPNVTSEVPRPTFELAQVFREYGAEYCRTHFVTSPQRKVMRAILQCRTAALGGHVDECETCGHQQVSYNSCRNRHCPKCQGLETGLWVEAQLADLLPIEYYHVVFTLPHQLNGLARAYPREVYDLLFAAATQTLLEFGRRELGGELGITAVLHTWGQTLQQHLHLHCIVTGGALAAEGGSFRRCRQGYLFGVLALSAVFRQRYVRGLEQWAERAGAKDEEGGRLSGELRRLAEVLGGAEFVVYAKRPMSGPRQVIEYLSRYTQRVAISNSRLESISQGVVSFRWKDYRAGGQVKLCQLPGAEFLRRFLQHVLPAGYVRIRHYGILASRGRREKLARCRALLAAREGEPRGVPPAAVEWLESWREMKRETCEQCGRGRMVRVGEWEWGVRPPPSVAVSERKAA